MDEHQQQNRREARAEARADRNEQADAHEMAMDLTQLASAAAWRETRFPMADFEDDDGRLPNER